MSAEFFVQQWSNKHPLAVRLGEPKHLHDRLIVVDGKTAWALGQSFNKLAERAHTTLVRMPPDAGPEKIAAYEQLWGSATQLS